MNSNKFKSNYKRSNKASNWCLSVIQKSQCNLIEFKRKNYEFSYYYRFPCTVFILSIERTVERWAHFISDTFFISVYPIRWSYYFMIEIALCNMHHCWKTKFCLLGFVLCLPIFADSHSVFSFKIDQLKRKKVYVFAINCIGGKWW